jgi:hypothetical protein
MKWYSPTLIAVLIQLIFFFLLTYPNPYPNPKSKLPYKLEAAFFFREPKP